MPFVPLLTQMLLPLRLLPLLKPLSILVMLDHVDSERPKEGYSIQFPLGVTHMMQLSLQLPIPLLVMAVQLVLLKRMLVSQTGSGSNASGN